MWAVSILAVCLCKRCSLRELLVSFFLVQNHKYVYEGRVHNRGSICTYAGQNVVWVMKDHDLVGLVVLVGFLYSASVPSPTFSPPCTHQFPHSQQSVIQKKLQKHLYIIFVLFSSPFTFHIFCIIENYCQLILKI